jgi:hypothetical protein
MMENLAMQLKDMNVSLDKNTMSKFIFGTGAEDKHNYVVHTDYPFFIAKYSSDDVETENLQVKLNGTVFYDFSFFEEPPATEEELRELVRDATSAAKEAATARRGH